MEDRLKTLFAATTTTTQAQTALAAPKRRTGAPKGNQNGYKHGLRSSRLGPGMKYIAAKATEFRSAAEAETLAVRGKIGIWEESLLQTATQWLITALKIERVLRLAGKELTHQDYANLAERVARACSERDKSLTKLGLDAADPKHATLYTLPELPPDEPAAAPGESQANAPTTPPT